jgi:hypothetical protein
MNDRKDNFETEGMSNHTMEQILEQRRFEPEKSEVDEPYDWGKFGNSIKTESPKKNKELKPEPLNDGSDFEDEIDHSRPGDFSNSGGPDPLSA